MARRDIFDVEDERPAKEPKSKAYPRQLTEGAIEPDHTQLAGDKEYPWPAGMPVDAQPMAFSDATAEIQRMSSQLLGLADQELREMMVAWRHNTDLMPTSFKAIALVMANAGGTPDKRAPVEAKPDTGLEALAKALTDGEK